MNARVEQWMRDRPNIPRLVRIHNGDAEALLDVVEYARLDALRGSLTMEEVLGRPAVPGDGCFTVGV